MQEKCARGVPWHAEDIPKEKLIDALNAALGGARVLHCPGCDWWCAVGEAYNAACVRCNGLVLELQPSRASFTGKPRT